MTGHRARSLGVVAVWLSFACRGAAPPPAPTGPWTGWNLVTAYLDSAVQSGAAPGSVLGVSWRGRHRYYGTGRLGLFDPTRPDSTTVYDLASLTKVIGLTTLVMQAIDQHRLQLDEPVGRYLPAFAGPGKERVMLRHLLTHSSGLPAWRPLYQETTTRAEGLALVDATPLDTAPGSRTVYSDLGAIVLGQVVESVMGHRLDTLIAERVAAPLGLTSTRYLPPEAWLARTAPTENDPWRGRVLRGEVHDENASRLDGVSGHAGLFSDAVDLLRFGDWLLAEWRQGGTVREFGARQNLVPGSSRALGWDTPSEGSSAGSRLSPDSFGHTGFTGTSIWMDPHRDLVIVLLSNRVHPTRRETRWLRVRGEVADRVVASLPGEGLSR